MKARLLLLLTMLCIMPWLKVSAQQVLYDNGPVNSNTDAWKINFGFVVSDTFLLQSPATVTGFEFYVWMQPGDTPLTVDWSMTSGENGGTVYGSGTANLQSTFLFTSTYGFDIDKETASGLNVAIPAGQYWLNLQNATSTLGGIVYWDENSGAGCKSLGCPSLASDTDVGTIPSESFAIDGKSQVEGAPEPGSMVLFVSCWAACGGVLRRKMSSI